MVKFAGAGLYRCTHIIEAAWNEANRKGEHGS
jgi:hypothetical protein